MALLLLSYEWSLQGVPKDRFWKIVRMPALPIVGMTLHLEFENDPSALKICDISWDEAYPKFFEIQLEPKDYDEDPTTRMVASGWTCEALNPACVGMIGVRS